MVGSTQDSWGGAVYKIRWEGTIKGAQWWPQPMERVQGLDGKGLGLGAQEMRAKGKPTLHYDSG